MASSAAMAATSALKPSSVCTKTSSSSSVPVSMSDFIVLLHTFAQARFPLNFLSLFLQSLLTDSVFLTLPWQKEHFPEADQPMVPDLHRQHFSVVPKSDQSSSAMASSAAMAATSALKPSSVCTKAS